MSDTVLVSASEGVATITLNRPDALNSLTVELKEALLETLLHVAADPAARAVVLTGAGRGFCAGQDLREHGDGLASGDAAPLARCSCTTTRLPGAGHDAQAGHRRGERHRRRGRGRR